MSGLATELREAALRAEQEGEPLALLDEAAAEIDRLRAICKDYADVCACTEKEIKRLKATIASMANGKEPPGESPNPCQPAQNPQ